MVVFYFQDTTETKTSPLTLKGLPVLLLSIHFYTCGGCFNYRGGYDSLFSFYFRLHLNQTHTLLSVLHLNFAMKIYIFIFIIFLYLRRCFFFSISIISLHLPPASRYTRTHAAEVGVNFWTAVLGAESTQMNKPHLFPTISSSSFVSL